MRRFLATLILLPAWMYVLSCVVVLSAGVALMRFDHWLIAALAFGFFWRLVEMGLRAFSKPPLKPDQDHVVIVPLTHGNQR